MTTDTDALLATVRDALLGNSPIEEWPTAERSALAALDSLAAELERVKAERDEWAMRCQMLTEAIEQAAPSIAQTQARLDKARKALQQLGGMTHGEDTMRIIREALKETE